MKKSELGELIAIVKTRRDEALKIGYKPKLFDWFISLLQKYYDREDYPKDIWGLM